MKPLAEDIWLVDGPVIRFGPACLKMPFPTRTTVIRLGCSDLFIHSPTPLSPALQGAIEVLGQVRYVIGPNRLHYSWIADWHAAYPQAEIFLAPGILEQSRGRVDGPATLLQSAQGYPWDGAIATLPITGRYMTEVEFFHVASRTLILTDLIENFEREKLGSSLMAWLAHLGGVLDPHGSMPRDLRLTFLGHEAALRAAVKTMIGWDPVRVVLAHGRCYQNGGTDELRRAFRWLLKGHPARRAWS